jgi:hypothetical protein
LVTPALNQDIENETGLVDGTPEPMLFPGDADVGSGQAARRSAESLGGRERHHFWAALGAGREMLVEKCPFGVGNFASR